MNTQVDIYSGFLGAGKTFLIKSLLERNAYGENTVIIENEFGEVSIDGTILNNKKMVIKEITSGCICCEINNNFNDSLLEVLDNYNPSVIIIEPSGIAKLSEILNILKEIRYKDRLTIRNVITIVDVNNFEYYLYNFKEFYINQIKYAQKIVLSRSEGKHSSYIQNIVSEIRNINKDTVIFKGNFDKIEYLQLLNSNFNGENCKSNRYSKFIGSSSKHKFESFKIDLHKPVNNSELKEKFELINKKLYGTIIRAKGIITTSSGEYYILSYVNNEFSLKKIKWGNKKCIQFIGYNLKQENIKSLFN